MFFKRKLWKARKVEGVLWLHQGKGRLRIILYTLVFSLIQSNIYLYPLDGHRHAIYWTTLNENEKRREGKGVVSYITIHTWEEAACQDPDIESEQGLILIDQQEPRRRSSNLRNAPNSLQNEVVLLVRCNRNEWITNKKKKKKPMKKPVIDKLRTIMELERTSRLR